MVAALATGATCVRVFSELVSDCVPLGVMIFYLRADRRFSLCGVGGDEVAVEGESPVTGKNEKDKNIVVM